MKEPIGYDPCATSKIEDYLKRDDVQRALHANVTGLLYPYSRCRFDDVTCFLSFLIQLICTAYSSSFYYTA